MWQWRHAAYCGVSRREWLERFTAKELTEYEAACRVEWLGVERVDWQWACIVATLKNQWAANEADIIKPDDLLGAMYREHRDPDADAKVKAELAAAQLKNWAYARNAQIEQHGNRN